jgi:hypothetical protein
VYLIVTRACFQSSALCVLVCAALVGIASRHLVVITTPDHPTSTNTMALSVRDRVGGALWGMFIGDALSMPVHWIYSPESLRQEYGVVRDFLAPKRSHPSSIMSLHSADRAGRKAYGNAASPRKIVGDVILKGKRHLWEEPKLHYHFGLQAGDNTLNLLVARVLMRSIATSGRYDADHFLKEYISFMTAGADSSIVHACPCVLSTTHYNFFADLVSCVFPFWSLSRKLAQ